MKELPFNQKAALLLNGAMEKGALSAMAAKYRLTAEHFLISAPPAFTPLHYAMTWREGFEQVVETLKTSDRPLAFAHFLTEDAQGWTGLQWAASKGLLNRVREVVKPEELRWTAESFLRENTFRQSALQLAAENHHLDQVLIPSLWICRVGEMETLWRNVPESQRAGIDYDALRKEAIDLSVKTVPKVSVEDFARARRGNAHKGPVFPGRERT